MITKYNQFNEGIKKLMVGPSEEEVWYNNEGNLIFETIPPTLVDFLDKLINESKISGDINNNFYCKFDNNKIFFIVFRIFDKKIHLESRIKNIILNYYLNESKEYDYYMKQYGRLGFHINKITLMYYILTDYFTKKYDRYLEYTDKI